MRTNYFADIVKNVGKTGQDGQDNKKSYNFNALQTNPSCPTPGKIGQDRARLNDYRLAHLAQHVIDRARRCKQEKDNKGSGLAYVLPILPILPTEIDNSATPRTPDEHEAFEERATIQEYDGGLTHDAAERAASANRQAMPVIAGVVDQFRKVFGADQVRVSYAEEGGRKVGTSPPLGIKPVLTGDKVPMPKEVRT